MRTLSPPRGPPPSYNPKESTDYSAYTYADMVANSSLPLKNKPILPVRKTKRAAVTRVAPNIAALGSKGEIPNTMRMRSPLLADMRSCVNHRSFWRYISYYNKSHPVFTSYGAIVLK